MTSDVKEKRFQPKARFHLYVCRVASLSPEYFGILQGGQARDQMAPTEQDYSENAVFLPTSALVDL